MKPLSAIWKNSSISKAILMALVCVSIIPIIVVFLVSINENNVALTEQMAENLRVLVQARAEELDNQLQQIQSTLAEVAPLALNALPNEPQLQSILTSVQVSNPASQTVYVIMPDGALVAANGRSPLNANAITQATHMAVPQWHIPQGDEWLLTVSLLMDDGGQMAVLAQEINLYTLTQSHFTTNLLTEAVHIAFFTSQGDVVFGADATNVPATVPSLATAVITLADDGTEQLRITAPMAEMGWGILITIPSEAIQPPASPSLRVRSLILMVAVVIFVVIMAAFLTRMIHYPLKLLLAGVEELSTEGRAQEIAVDSFRELNHLAQAFNEMSAKIWQREKVLKAQVAHLRIEIDTSQKTQQIESLVKTDFFKELELNAARLRDELKQKEVE